MFLNNILYMKKTIFFLIQIVISFNLLNAQVVSFDIDKYQLKHYKTIKKALKTPDNVYALSISSHTDKKLFKHNINNDSIKLKLHLENISKFKNLYSLTIDDLGIINFPDISECEYLEEVCVSRLNNLNWNSFFSEIEKNKNIKYIRITGCDNVEITKKIGNIKELKSLTISYSNYLVIDSNIGNLKKLEYVTFNKNNLQYLPEEIGKIENLREIRFFDNPNLDLSQTFKILSKCKNLNLINLSAGGIEELPENIGTIQNLEQLYIGNNKLKTLPMSLCDLPKLEAIILDGQNNTMENLPIDFEERIQLIKLENGNFIKK